MKRLLWFITFIFLETEPIFPYKVLEVSSADLFHTLGLLQMMYSKNTHGKLFIYMITASTEYSFKVISSHLKIADVSFFLSLSVHRAHHTERGKFVPPFPMLQSVSSASQQNVVECMIEMKKTICCIIYPTRTVKKLTSYLVSCQIPIVLG